MTTETARSGAVEPHRAPTAEAGPADVSNDPARVGADQRATGVGRLSRFAIRRPDRVAAAGYLALALWTCGGLFLNPYDRLSGHNPTDQVWFQWLLEHGAYSLRHFENPLFSERQNVPFGVNLMANTSVLGISLPLAPITILFGGEISYWVFLVGGLAGTAYAVYHVFSRHLVESRIAAWLGGAFIGFAPGVVHHANGQPNFSTHFLVPFLILYAVRLGRPGRTVRDGVALALLVTWQFFINQEVLLITAVAAAVITIIRIPRLWRSGWRILGSLAVTAGLAGALLAYPMWFQFNGPQSYRGLPFDFHSWGEDLTAYVTFARDTLAGDKYVEQTIGLTEQNTWFGWPLVLVIAAAAALLWRRSAPARVTTVAGLLFALLAVGPQLTVGGEPRDIPGPWMLISTGHVPVLDLLQPTRLTLVVTGAVGILIALAWDRLRHVRAPRRRNLGYAAIALALVPIAPWILPTQTAPEIPAFISDGHWREYVPKGYTMLPAPVPNNADGIWTLRYSVRGRQEFPIPHGYFIGPDDNGRGWYGPVSRMTSFWVNHVARHGVLDGRADTVPSEEMKLQMKQDLVFWRVAVVVIGPHPHQQQLKALWDEVLGPARRSHGAWIYDVRWLTATGRP